MLGLVSALWFRAHSLRPPAAILFLAAVDEALTNPPGLTLFALLGVRLGLRLVLRGDVAEPLRDRPTPLQSA